MNPDWLRRVVDGGLVRSSQNLAIVFAGWNNLDSELQEVYEHQLNWLLEQVPAILKEHPECYDRIKWAVVNIDHVTHDFDKKHLLDSHTWEIAVNLVK